MASEPVRDAGALRRLRPTIPAFDGDLRPAGGRMLDGRFRSTVDGPSRPSAQTCSRTGINADHFTALGLALAAAPPWPSASGAPAHRLAAASS